MGAGQKLLESALSVFLSVHPHPHQGHHMCVLCPLHAHCLAWGLVHTWGIEQINSQMISQRL